ncbi:MAG TPA: fused MFS/spermidine synthase, partial [Vicinamibacteria bacterium]|nr:fused MFS/spermidine synthase [Vicinamibacteria bacterium]
ASWPSPLTPGGEWKPDPAASPAPLILALLAAGVGLPYLALAGTGPLVQSWFARLRPGASPYRLFALSNLGSLVGLLAYPFAVEPSLPVVAQGWWWTAGFALFAVAMGSCAFAVGRAPGRAASAPEEAAPPAPIRYLLWFGLAAVGSTLLLAVTNEVCQDVAVVPFLWVLPLVLYLLSFVLCFEYERLYRREAWLAVVAAGAAAATYALYRGTDLGIRWQVAIHSATLFAYCMACHGELAKGKPPPAHLTSFYLTVAAGGAAGGVFTGLLAPLLFPGYWELHLALVAGPVLLVAALLLDPDSRLNRGEAKRVWALRIGAYAGMAVLAGALGNQAYRKLLGAGDVRRGFFGVVAVALENRGRPDEWRKLRHGRIAHGLQFSAPARRREPTTYYGPGSGAALALRRHPRRLAGEPLRVGLVGLGVGTLAAYARPGDVFRAYEINPDVLRLSTGPDPLFTFLRDAPAEVTTVLGDARLALEREAPQRFDVLVLDAFASDAIPVHLLTREAFALYVRHLREPGGVLAAHVSNKYLDLRPLVRGLAGAFGLRAALVESQASGAIWSSDWVLAVRDDALLRDPEVDAAALPLAVGEPGLPVWTDDYSNLLGVLKR